MFRVVRGPLTRRAERAGGGPGPRYGPHGESPARPVVDFTVPCLHITLSSEYDVIDSAHARQGFIVSPPCAICVLY